jgi:nitrogen fixation protein NifU and related proteins
MPLKYTDKVMFHFMNPCNLGEIKNPDVEVIEGNLRCGDQIQLHLKIKNNIIEDIKFKSFGCASNIATASIVTDLAKGKTLDEAKKITWKEVSEKLGGLPKIKEHCSVLAVQTLKKAIKEYENKKELKEK